MWKNSERMQMQKVKDTIKNAAPYSSGDALKLFSGFISLLFLIGQYITLTWDHLKQWRRSYDDKKSLQQFI